MENKYLVIYHKEDNDGVFSAAIVKNYLQNEVHIDEQSIVMWGTTYADLSSYYQATAKSLTHLLNEYTHVITVDISFNEPNAMIQLYKLYCDRFVWNDHHLAAITQSIKHGYDKANGYRDTSRASILQTYRYFYDQLDIDYYANESSIKLLKILSAWDNFNWDAYSFSKDYVMGINKAINLKVKLDIQKAYDLVHDIIYTNTIDDAYIQSLDETGQLLNEYDNSLYENIVETNGDLTWTVNTENGPRSACAIFYSAPSSTIMFQSLKGKIQNGIVFKKNSNNSWTLSLYNVDQEDTFNCGTFLKSKYKKGGGHVGAAGCTLSKSKVLKMLREKCI